MNIHLKTCKECGRGYDFAQCPYCYGEYLKGVEKRKWEKSQKKL